MHDRRAPRTKNRVPAAIQITAEQLLRKAPEQQETVFHASKQRVEAFEEFHEHAHYERSHSEEENLRPLKEWLQWMALQGELARKSKQHNPALPLPDPQPAERNECISALHKKAASIFCPRDRDSIQPPTLSTSQLPPSPCHCQVSREADHNDFSRRLKMASFPSPRSPHPHKSVPAFKLFDPDTDPIPMLRTAEPEALSDATGNSYVHFSHPAPQSAFRDERASSRQLFDHHKDDPVRFSVLARPQQLSAHHRAVPTPKSSGDYVSASSTSSYAASISSSAFTLSSTTDGSSASSAFFDGCHNQGQRTEVSGTSVISFQLKKLYRAITNLETKIKEEDFAEEAKDTMFPRIMLKGKEFASEDLDKDKWKKQIDDHKQLAEVIHDLLEISLAPSVPASLRNIPTKYNIIVRLWTYAFHKLLESLRRASFSSSLALEHLQDFIYYAYTFYTGLLEEPTLNLFKLGWLEALGDLARYRMAVAAMVNGSVGGQGGLTTKAIAEASESSATDAADAETGMAMPGSSESVSDYPAARIDDSPSPSVGLTAARLLDVEPEKEHWRNIARDWYGAGLAEQPGTGKLHHHLGLLSREVEGEELQAVYHFVKSMTTLHPFLTSRESILPIWSATAQTRRSAPDARASELFVLLHGMLFTNIQLDDFLPTLARFIERLEIEGAEEREWIMMAVINVSSVLEYGRPNGLLRKIGCVGPKEVNGPQVAAAMRVMAKKAAAGVPGSSNADATASGTMDVDEEHKGDAPMKSPTASSVEPEHEDDATVPTEHPPTLKFALQLTFAMLSHVLRWPTRKASQYARSNINPYLTVLLTFLSTVLKHRPTLDSLERSIPWEELTAFFATIPRKILISEGLMSPHGKPNTHRSAERWIMLTSGCFPPMPEDWCLRGMEWVGRKVYERGFWKSGEDHKAELEVLQTFEGGELTDGTIEDDDGDGHYKGSSSSSSSDLVRRWVRIARCAVNIAGTVDGFKWTDGTRTWVVEGKLADKLKRWKEEEQIEREEEERRRMGKRWVEDAMDVDEEEADGLTEESEDDENDLEGMKARCWYVKTLLQSAIQDGVSFSTPRRPRVARTSQTLADLSVKLPIVTGYTILVIDTNILLSTLSMVSSLIKSLRWTVVLPLPVIMKLDSLSSNASQLREAVQIALQYISSHVHSHALSLKAQTSNGNYLTTFNVQTPAKLPIVPGYTILVVDTNILLSTLSMVPSFIESLRWTVVLSLPVIMKLDGLSSNASQLHEAVQIALQYISSHVRSHALSLKVQTSNGNYLTTLNVQNPAKLPIVPGYTILVVDTDILLSTLSKVPSLIESLRSSPSRSQPSWSSTIYLPTPRKGGDLTRSSQFTR